MTSGTTPWCSTRRSAVRSACVLTAQRRRRGSRNARTARLEPGHAADDAQAGGAPCAAGGARAARRASARSRRRCARAPRRCARGVVSSSATGTTPAPRRIAPRAARAAAATGQHDTACGNGAVRLQQHLRGAGGQHAGQRPAGDRKGPLDARRSRGSSARAPTTRASRAAGAPSPPCDSATSKAPSSRRSTANTAASATAVAPERRNASIEREPARVVGADDRAPRAASSRRPRGRSVRPAPARCRRAPSQARAARRRSPPRVPRVPRRSPRGRRRLRDLRRAARTALRAAPPGGRAPRGGPSAGCDPPERRFAPLPRGASALSGQCWRPDGAHRLPCIVAIRMPAATGVRQPRRSGCAVDRHQAVEARAHQAERPARRSGDRRHAAREAPGEEQRRRDRVAGTPRKISPSIVTGTAGACATSGSGSLRNIEASGAVGCERLRQRAGGDRGRDGVGVRRRQRDAAVAQWRRMRPDAPPTARTPETRRGSSRAAPPTRARRGPRRAPGTRALRARPSPRARRARARRRSRGPVARRRSARCPRRSAGSSPPAARGSAAAVRAR